MASEKRTIVLTGASDGIGAIAARALSGPSTNLILVGGSPQKLAPIAAETGARSFTADFADLAQVRDLAAQISGSVESIDVLMNNAGGTFDHKDRTADGHEPNFQINHLAPFLLTHLLRDRLAAAGSSLVLNTASVGNLAGSVDFDDLDFEKRRALALRPYGTAKLMNILFTRGISQRWSDDKIYSAAVHPGPAATSFGRDSRFVGLAYRSPITRLVTITPEQGAAPLIALAERGADPSVNGVYFSRHKPNGLENRQAHDQKLIDGLWEKSAELTGLN
ncbi:SDR family NAD(P)-dependent oxidoreductase [Gordonia alkanivorans]|uniref:SDR family NAD(P)-dependent oxidoreductase n=1 Tax=Gordonia alkanivorans TaxID=84096 RepID=UPI00244A0E09|nr:SDR family NAD(P)-dependent oxidoreductase [Gordonia alkanivorans]MDH3006205.1 SDR family NAD(P)-dependent oxidoreductase [Gordonia alkanivorans]MDH3015960.1 SDR family NAD(P)-dependent oxidoreductase [Gordonia alkanivorans]MDH3040536.1 SDR family NAD(P)-dependent oxidoreductase [Gordonia alkanivorans]MDH3047548.1 SDR family NAD(P)-dependent oxidoreductase [Gordonia alkanivorans]MDH3051202.1 SDR family NAD(P)-dependent oxidoreductase [Gordonia alkanivorans]